MTADLAIEAATTIGKKLFGAGAGGFSQNQNPASGIYGSQITMGGGSVIFAAGDVSNADGLPGPATSLANGVNQAFMGNTPIFLIGAAALFLLALYSRR